MMGGVESCDHEPGHQPGITGDTQDVESLEWPPSLVEYNGFESHRTTKAPVARGLINLF